MHLDADAQLDGVDDHTVPSATQDNNMEGILAGFFALSPHYDYK